MVRESDWVGLYKRGWGSEICPESYVHPAKFARGLIRCIYEHALERGWLAEGDLVLDPFAGVALGGLGAMFHGLHWVGVELEEKFVSLGQQNIDLWNRRYGNGLLPRWGTATILQGDSRNLARVLAGARAEGIIASPPFQQQVSVQDIGFYHKKCVQTGRNPDSAHAQGINSYGTDPANLGNMPAGEPPSAVISSPPTGKAQSGGVGFWEGLEEKHGRVFSARVREGSQGYRGDQLGDSEGQLGAMREGEPPRAILSSPPYIDSMDSPEKCGIDWKKAGRPDRCKPSDKRISPQVDGGMDYGRADGQLAAMREGDVDAVIASPPYVSTLNDGRHGGGIDESKRKHTRKAGPRGQTNIAQRYGTSDGQLAALPEGEPPAAIVQVDACISSPPYWDSLERRGEKPEDVRARMQEKGWSEESIRKVTVHSNDTQSGYGVTEGQLAAEIQPDTFWSAARAILDQCHRVLAPGGYAIWILKDFIRSKKRVDFTGQWRALCESCGFETVEVIRAWLVEERETKLELFTADTSATMHKLDGGSEYMEGENFEQGRERKRVVERKSFFRRLAERKGSPRIDWEVVLVTRKT